jgi:HNH endonuclease
MVHDLAGNVLNVGRRTRKPPPGLRRAVRERDRYRCRFPGCESRRTDIHHIIYWSHGGQTTLSGLICLCKRHHAIVHDKKMIIANTGGGFAFYTKEGTLIPASPPLPPPDGDITACHDAAVTPATIIPPNSGERLDLHLAIWIAFTNARTRAERRQREQQDQLKAALSPRALSSSSSAHNFLNMCAPRLGCRARRPHPHESGNRGRARCGARWTS